MLGIEEPTNRYFSKQDPQWCQFTNPTLKAVPLELWIKLFGHLETPSLARLELSCRSFRLLLKDRDFCRLGPVWHSAVYGKWLEAEPPEELVSLSLENVVVYFRNDTIQWRLHNEPMSALRTVSIEGIIIVDAQLLQHNATTALLIYKRFFGAEVTVTEVDFTGCGPDTPPTQREYVDSRFLKHTRSIMQSEDGHLYALSQDKRVFLLDKTGSDKLDCDIPRLENCGIRTLASCGAALVILYKNDLVICTERDSACITQFKIRWSHQLEEIPFPLHCEAIEDVCVRGKYLCMELVWGAVDERGRVFRAWGMAIFDRTTRQCVFEKQIEGRLLGRQTRHRFFWDIHKNTLIILGRTFSNRCLLHNLRTQKTEFCFLSLPGPVYSMRVDQASGELYLTCDDYEQPWIGKVVNVKLQV